MGEELSATPTGNWRSAKSPVAAAGDSGQAERRNCAAGAAGEPLRTMPPDATDRSRCPSGRRHEEHTRILATVIAGLLVVIAVLADMLMKERDKSVRIELPGVKIEAD